MASWSRLTLLVPLASLVAVLLVAVALVALALVAVPLAHADGDPASDYLLGQQTFVPPDAGFSASEKQQLTQLVTGARRGTRLPGAPGRGGYGVRVAVIASRYDLGSVTVLAKQPKLYAHFLSQELRFVYKGRVLVVMPNGYGIADNGKPAPAEQRVLDRLPPPAAGSGSALATATTRAVRALAANANVRIASVQPPVARTTSNGSSTRDRILIAAVALVLLCAGAVVVLYRRWR